MPYFSLEFKALPLSGPKFQQFRSGQIINSSINGKKCQVEVDEDELSIDGVLYPDVTGTAKLDTKKFSSSYIVFLTEMEVDKLKTWHSNHSRGAYIHALSSMERRAQEYLGLRKPGQRSFLDKISARFTNGASEALDL